MDIVDNLKSLQLFDAYGNMLTDKQRECLNDYLINNLTLSEISQINGISRQAVNFNIKESLKSLQNMEEKLGFCEKCDRIEEVLESSMYHKDDIRKIMNILKE
ncbi:MAG: hypothetical protein E7361_02830 [Clostridiales bacterium]|nr:hypothetical protein [Clostridiales bacterium]